MKKSMTPMRPREKWDALASRWMRVQPPAAPSTQDADHYVRLCGAGVTGNVLLLGCTPLLRARLRSDSKRLICADISDGMAKQSLQELPRASHEEFINTDWLHLPLASESVDCIAGDKVFDNVHPCLWNAWLGELARVLKPGGAFVTRLSPRGKLRLRTPHRLTFVDLVQKWTDSLAEDSSTIENACSGLWEDSLAASTKALRGEDRVGIQCIGKIVPSTPAACLAVGETIPNADPLLTLFVERYWESRFATWTAYSLEGVIEATAEHFAVSEILVSFDYPESQRQPVLGLERRAVPQERNSNI